MTPNTELKPWKNLLVYADGREDSAIGVRKALAIAEHSDGRVTAFDAIGELPSRLPVEFAGMELSELHKLARERRTEALVDGLGSVRARVPMDVVVRVGMPALELIRHAVNRGVDLIIKTAQGRDVRRMTTFGSTALHLVRKSPVPVWLQNPHVPAARRVLAAVNLGAATPEREELSRRIVSSAQRIAELEGAELHVLYVVDAGRERLYRNILTASQFEAYAFATLRAARELLERFVATEAPGARLHLRQGEPVDVIAEFVREHDIQFVVMGSVGRSGVAGLLIGELAEDLLCRVDCSVLTLKPAGFVTPIAI